MTAVAWSWPRSTIVRVIDGDSHVARLTRDLGFHGVAVFEQRLRLARINCKPAKTDLGIQATAFVRAYMDDLVDIVTVGPYAYGDEWMAEVGLPGGANLSDTLVAQGLAVYWDGHGPRPDVT